MEGGVIGELLKHSTFSLLESIESVKNSVLARVCLGFQYGDIPAYCRELRLISELMACFKHGSPAIDDKRLVPVISDVQKACFLLLAHTCPTLDNRKDCIVLLGSLCHLMAKCVLVDTSILLSVLQNVSESIDSFFQKNTCGADEKEGTLDIHATLELLRQVLRDLHAGKWQVGGGDMEVKFILREIYQSLKSSLEFLSNDLIGTICIPIFIQLLEIDKENVKKYLSDLWLCVVKFSAEDQQETKHYLLLCGLAGWFFPVSGFSCGSTDAVGQERLWLILQQGLISQDSLTRKRSLYLVKRIVDTCEKTDAVISTGLEYPIFWWSKESKADLSRTWEDFMLLAEVLEEKQVHVIKPLLSRMKSLIQAASLTSKGAPPLLHTTWLVTVLLRCTYHESLQIIRWSADTTLSLDLTRCPLLQQGQQKYLTGLLLQTLTETKLFNRETGSSSGSMPVLGEKVATFFKSCYDSLPQDERGGFFRAVVQILCGSRWGTIPLLFVCRGLSQVPSSPCLDTPAVLSMRKLLTGDLVTAEGYLRGAISGFIIQIVLNLTNRDEVSVEDVMQVLMQVQQDDCLQRGTTLWQQCATWLTQEGDNPGWSGQAIRAQLDTAVTKYLEVTIDSKFSSADTVVAHGIARLLLLAADASIATSSAPDEPDLLLTVTGKLELIINSINSHSYMSTHKADKALQLLALLVQELCIDKADPADPVVQSILTAVTNCQQEMVLYISGQIVQAIVVLLDRSLLTLYMDCVEMLMNVRHMVKSIRVDGLLKTCVATLNAKAKAEQISLQTRMQQLSAMCTLGKIADCLSHDLKLGRDFPGSAELQQMLLGFMTQWEVVTHFQRPSNDENVSQQEWGKITSLYLQHQWQATLLCLHIAPATWCPPLELLNLATDTLAVGLEETAIPVMKCIAVLIEQALCARAVSDAEIVAVVNATWKSVREARRSQILWAVLQAAIHLVFQPCLLKMPPESPVMQRVNECALELLEYGSEKTGVVNLLVSQLARVWTQPDMTDHIVKFAPIIVELCRFGGQPTRNQRQLYDVAATVEALGDQCVVNSLKKRIANGDLLVRATIIDFLCGLDPSCPSHCCLATELVRLCSSFYASVLQGSNNKYANSIVHRQRHRLIQTVLLLNPLVTQDYVPELWQFAWSSLEQECQPSIRHVLEWIVLAVMARQPQLGQNLWTLFEKYRDSKNVVLCSLLCIVIHVGPNLPPGKQELFYKEALASILPWCMAHHFQTRIFAQATLCKLWRQCQELQLQEILEANAILDTLVQFNQENRNSTTNVKKLLDSFFFKNLNFKTDFTLEIIYHVLPQMTDLTEEDWIQPEMFVRVNPAWASGQRSGFVHLQNNTDHLQQFEMAKWRYTALRIVEDGDGVEGGSGDVQKKIMPWRQMVADLETSEELEHGLGSHDRQGLVVVTSLITKLPNLGGLCRTSEIFGVSEYVLGKLKYTEDKAFQGLSVTAHKWLPITEVPEQRLPEYLQEKRLEGYTLVGVEQTANSTCLTNFTFPTKTLLLLGNEKEGLPVELISLLDVCVEIPQQGVVRSLNVHVSGALLIWEYRRQQLLKTQQTN